jgi:hypothetical protein
MINARLEIDTDILDAVLADLDRFPTLLNTAFKRALPRWLSQLDAFIRDLEPPPAKASPYVWSLNKDANDRARKWYFRQLALGKIPTDGQRYQRTGAMLDAFEITTLFSNNAIGLEVVNSAPGVDYVMGERQIYGHKQTGWPKFEVIDEQFSDHLNSLAITTYLTIVDATF